MIDLNKKCNLYKCAVCLHKEACWNGAFSYNNDFELAGLEEIKTRLTEEDYTMSQKSLMLDILKRYITGEIVVAEKEKEPIDKEKETKTYEQGLEDAWEIFKLLDDANRDEWDEIFGKDRDNIAISLHTMSIHEIKSKVDAWEAEKNKPKLGDVVEFAEKILGLELLEYQKYLLRLYSTLPYGTKVVMGRSGPIILDESGEVIGKFNNHGVAKASLGYSPTFTYVDEIDTR